MSLRHFLIIFFLGATSLQLHSAWGEVMKNQNGDGVPVATVSPHAYQEIVKSTNFDAQEIGVARFAEWMKQPGTVVLDLRAEPQYSLSHVRGAKNLGPDFREDKIAKLVPSKTTRILLYCENSLQPYSRAIPQTVVALPQFRALGYNNVYWLSGEGQNNGELPMVSGE